MEIVVPFNNVILKLKTKWIKNFTSLYKMAAIQNLTSVDPADYVNIVGEVVAVPREITTNRREYKNFTNQNIQVGDTAIFSHDVVHSFLQTDPEAEPIYRNLFRYGIDEYWRCDIQWLFAVVRNGKIHMVNDYIMVERMDKPSKIYLPTHLRKRTSTAKAVVTHVQSNDEICVGDTVFFNPTKLQIYQINEKPFGVLRLRDVLGFQIPDYGTEKFLN